MSIKEWWLQDPLSAREGMGVVLHKPQRQWIVARTLIGSPAEAAGMATADSILLINGYDLAAGDIHEVLLLASLAERGNLYRRKDGSFDVEVRRGRANSLFSIKPEPLRELLKRDAMRGGDRREVCLSCRFCRPSSQGWRDCGGIRCKVPCLID